MTTEQDVLDDLVEAVGNTNRSNDDLLKVLKEGENSDVTLRDGTVVPSLSKRVASSAGGGNYLKIDSNLNDVGDKDQARVNLDVYSKAETDDKVGTPDATTSVAGKAKIASTLDAQTGTNDNSFITPKKLREAFNADGEAPVIPIRTKLIFDGSTNPPTIIYSQNVSSVSIDQYNVFKADFIKPMSSLNYGLFGTACAIENGDGRTLSYSHIGGTGGVVGKNLTDCQFVLKTRADTLELSPYVTVYFG